MADEYTRYETGLDRVRAQIPPSHPDHGTLLVFEQRLRDNLAGTRRYGDTEGRRAERAEIISRLDALVLAVLGRSFQAYCTLDPAPPAAPERGHSGGVTITGGTVVGPVVGSNLGSIQTTYGSPPATAQPTPPQARPAEPAQRVDLAIITAMPAELEPVLTLAGGRAAWTPLMIDRYQHYRATLTAGARPLTVVACTQGKHGAEETVSAFHRLAPLQPRLVAMTGICAGREGAVSLGDVVVADRAFRAQEGKRSEEGFAADTQTYQPPGWLMQPLREFAQTTEWSQAITTPRPVSLRYQSEWLLCRRTRSEPRSPSTEAEWGEVAAARIDVLRAQQRCQERGWLAPDGPITAAGEQALRELRMRSYGQLEPQPDPPAPRAHVGAYASTVDVVAIDAPFAEYLTRVRKALAIELEAHALLSTAANLGLAGLVVKGVSDYATPEKDDGWHAYAAEAAARWLAAFVRWYTPLHEPAA